MAIVDEEDGFTQLTKLNVTDKFFLRGSPLLASREILFTGRSTATDQSPTALDTELQIEFGVAQGDASTPLQLDAQGNITANETGSYQFVISLAVGRAGAAGVSCLYGRALLNTFQLGGSVLAELDNANVLIPFQFDIIVPMTVGDVLKIQIYRDSDGNNSGGLLQGLPNLAGWNNSETAVIAANRIATV